MDNIFSKRRISFIGKIIRMPCKCVLARLISTFQSEKILLCRPNTTIRHSGIHILMILKKPFLMLILLVDLIAGFI